MGKEEESRRAGRTRKKKKKGSKEAATKQKIGRKPGKKESTDKLARN